MKLQHQVCNREQAAALKELGITQEATFFWLDNYDFPVLNAGFSPNNPIACFTAGDLGEMLSGHRDLMLTTWRDERGVWLSDVDRCRSQDPFDVELIADGEGYSEAESRANVLLALLVGAYVSAEAVNARLNPNGKEVLE